MPAGPFLARHLPAGTGWRGRSTSEPDPRAARVRVRRRHIEPRAGRAAVALAVISR